MSVQLARALLLCGVPMVLTAQSAPTTPAAWRVVVADTSGFAVPYAIVDASPGGRRVADADGVVLYPRIAADSVLVHVLRIGFANASGWLRTGADGTVLLAPLARALKTVNVTERQSTLLAQRGFYERMERVQNGAIVGEFITPEDLERLSPATLSRAFVGSRYVRVARGSMSGPSDVVFLGRADCGFSILVDGQRIESQQERRRGLTSIDPNGTRRIGEGRPTVSLEELVPGSEVAAIEVYPSAANAPSELQARAMGGRGSCGVIAIWTGGRR